MSSPPETVFLLWKINKKYTPPFFIIVILKSKRGYKVRLLIIQHFNWVEIQTHTHILTDLVIHLLPGKPKPEVRISHIFLPPLWLVCGYHSPLFFIYKRWRILFTFWYAFLFNFFLQWNVSKLTYMQNAFLLKFFQKRSKLTVHNIYAKHILKKKHAPSWYNSNLQNCMVDVSSVLLHGGWSTKPFFMTDWQDWKYSV